MVESSDQPVPARRSAGTSGLQPLYVPYDVQPSFMIVAIHGLNGNSQSSWTDSSRVSWLDEFLPHELPDTTVWTYSYNGGPKAVANALKWDLIDLRTRREWELPILFLGHGSGGTIAKELFLISSPVQTSRPSINKLHHDMKGFIFLGTIHRGEHPQNLRSVPMLLKPLIASIPSGRQSLNDISQYFKEYQRINTDFQSSEGERLPIACFYETKETPRMGFVAPEDNSSIPAEWVMNRPLDADYAHLGKFSGRDDPNYVRVISAIHDLHDEILGLKPSLAPALQPHGETEPTVATSSNNEPHIGTGLRILALDGGGIRGLFGIIVLQAIMEEVRKIDSPDVDDSLKPCDYFDLIGGTSTGGLLAIMLGRLRMDLVSCKEAYKFLSKTIFNQGGWFSLPGMKAVDAIRGAPWYSGDPLQSSVKTTVSERLSQREKNELIQNGRSPREALMKDSAPGGTKTFVCAVLQDSDLCERLRTYDTRSNSLATPCTIWEACRATSAAPLYFPSIKINDRTYWDGGMNSNNPILQVVQEARSEFGEDANIAAIVSIGTGKAKKVDPGSHIFSLLKYAVKEMTNTEKKHVEFKANYPDLVERYFRFNEEERLHDIDLADWKKLAKVEQIADKYVASAQGRQLVLDCAKKLARRAPVAHEDLYN